MSVKLPDELKVQESLSGVGSHFEIVNAGGGMTRAKMADGDLAWELVHRYNSHQKLVEALEMALQTIDKLSDQQAMPDDSYMLNYSIIEAVVTMEKSHSPPQSVMEREGG